MKAVAQSYWSLLKRHTAWSGLLFLCVQLPGYAMEVDARLEWLHRVELGTLVKGIVKKVNVNSGERVKQGDVLLSLDQRGFRARLEGLEARLKNHRALRDEAKREEQRALELYDRTVLSDHDLQVARNNLIAADADYQSTLAQLKQARLDLEYSRLRAPFDALILARYAEVGQTVIPDLQPAVLFVLAAQDRLKAVALLDLQQLRGLTVGSKVRVSTPQGEFAGRIAEIGHEPDITLTGQGLRYRLSVEFDTQGKVLRAGSPVKLSLP